MGVGETSKEAAVVSPADWAVIAGTIAERMKREAFLDLHPDGLPILAQQLHSLALAIQLNDRIGPGPPAMARRKAEAIRQAAANLRALLENDSTRVVHRIADGAGDFLQNPSGQAEEADNDISRALQWIGYEAAFARTNVFGNVSYTRIALLPNLRAQLQALEEAARNEVEALQSEGRGVRIKDFRRIVIGQHLPNLYAEMYPTGGKGTYDPTEGKLRGPLYQFVQLASEALGLETPEPEAIHQAIRRERASSRSK